MKWETIDKYPKQRVNNDSGYHIAVVFDKYQEETNIKCRAHYRT